MRRDIGVSHTQDYFSAPRYDSRVVEIGQEGVVYERIQIGQFELVSLVRDIRALRNELDFLKSSLSRVLAEESALEVAEILSEAHAKGVIE